MPLLCIIMPIDASFWSRTLDRGSILTTQVVDSIGPSFSPESRTAPFCLSCASRHHLLPVYVYQLARSRCLTSQFYRCPILSLDLRLNNGWWWLVRLTQVQCLQVCSDSQHDLTEPSRRPYWQGTLPQSHDTSLDRCLGGGWRKSVIAMGKLVYLPT